MKPYGLEGTDLTKANKEGAEGMLKQGIKLVAMLGICMLFMVSCGAVAGESGDNGGKGNVDKSGSGLEGQWKVTDYLASTAETDRDDFYEHFLGRSIIIEPNRIIKSLGRWGDGTLFDKMEEDVAYQYRTVVTETVSGMVYADSLGDKWCRKYAGQDITVITLAMPESTKNYKETVFVVTEDGETLCWYLGNIYYMERYREAATDLKKKALYGEWKVKRLVSYQDGWLGRNDRFREYQEENGGYFYPLSYLGYTVRIGINSMELYGGGKLLENLRMDGYDSRLVNKYEYQNEKKIHDELGLTNEEIQVFDGNPQDTLDAVLDGEIVAVSDTEVIIRIYQGWYLLEKKENTEH